MRVLRHSMCDSQALELMRASLLLNPSLAPLIEPVHAMVGAAPGQLGLDAWAHGSGGFVPDFIKLDIEGGEVDALQSAARILSERHPTPHH